MTSLRRDHRRPLFADMQAAALTGRVAGSEPPPPTDEEMAKQIEQSRNELVRLLAIATEAQAARDRLPRLPEFDGLRQAIDAYAELGNDGNG